VGVNFYLLVASTLPDALFELSAPSLSIQDRWLADLGQF